MKIRTRYVTGVLSLCLAVLFTGAATVGAAEDDAEPAAKGQPAAAESAPTPTTLWAVQLEPDVDPDALAGQLGFGNLGQIATLDGFYLFEKLPEPALPAGFGSDPIAVEAID